MYKTLNLEQQAAVLTASAVSLIVAGAGSGKTRVITTRICHLIKDRSAEPKSIVCLTFTNKAAGEMRERLRAMMPDLPSYPYVGTFHSFCLYVMKSNSQVFEPGFLIMDEADQVQMVNRILKTYGLEKDFTPRKILSLISRYKNCLDKTNFEFSNNLIREFIEKYEQEKTKNRCFDFDDLILNVLYKLQNYPDFLALIQAKVRHILIDEYQDTSLVQHELIKLLSSDRKGNLVAASVFAVGDQDQSIYSWRGATEKNMQEFVRGFKDPAVFKLERNYRSVQPILELANRVIAQNAGRLEKTLWTDEAASNRIYLVNTYDEYREAELIAIACKQFLELNNNGQIAILLRAHFQSRILEEKMMEQAVTYKILGGLKFYERREIRDCLAMLRFCANPKDKQSFTRLTTFGLTGLGDGFITALFQFMDRTGITNIRHAFAQAIQEKAFKINKNQIEAYERLEEIFAGLVVTDSALYCLEKLVARLAYQDFLKNEYPLQEAEQRIENVYELIKSAQRFEEKTDGLTGQGNATVVDYLQEVALVEDHSEVESHNPVLIMTLHSAKGLEFDNVVIPAVEEGVVPYRRADEDVAQIQEECRLFYVGITRARKRLILTHAASRNHYGKRRSTDLSRFLDNATEELLQKSYCQTPGVTGKMLGFWLSGQVVPASPGDLMSARSVYSNFIPVKAKVASKTEQGNKSMSTIQPALKSRTFRKGSLVRHEKFGLGVVHAATKLTDGQLCLTVAFGKEHKKVLSTFLQPVRI
jgi:DNA helicase-2/ATP-dependent DNA helicase PcrA